MKNIKKSKEKNIMYYLDDVNKYDVLDKEEEKRLLKDYKLNNNLDSRNRLIECNQRLILDYVFSKTKDDNYILELVQEGNLGLIKAIDNFDLNYNTCLSTYSYFWIKLYVDMKIDKDKYFLTSKKYIKLKRDINYFIYEYYNNNLKYPTSEEIINALKINKKEFDYALNITKIISLDEIFELEAFDDSYFCQKSIYNRFFVVTNEENNDYLENKILAHQIELEIENKLDDKKIYIMKKKFGMLDEGFMYNDLELANELNSNVKLVNYHYRRAIKELKKSKNIKKMI